MIGAIYVAVMVLLALFVNSVRHYHLSHDDSSNIDTQYVLLNIQISKDLRVVGGSALINFKNCRFGKCASQHHVQRSRPFGKLTTANSISRTP